MEADVPMALDSWKIATAQPISMFHVKHFAKINVFDPSPRLRYNRAL